MTHLAVRDPSPETSAYLREQLPVVMAADPGLAEFLAGMDEMASELYDRIAGKELAFDIGVAPASMLRWRAAQIGVDIDPALPIERQRRIADAAASTFPARGTRASLVTNLRALTGDDSVKIDGEDESSILVVEEARSLSSISAAAGTGPDRVAEDRPAVRPVTIRLRSFGGVSQDTVEAAITREIPCDVPFEIFLSAEGQP